MKDIKLSDLEKNIKDLQLNDIEKNIINTIAIYSFFDECEREGIINKETFLECYESFNDEQRAILSYFVVKKAKISTGAIDFIKNRQK